MGVVRGRAGGGGPGKLTGRALRVRCPAKVNLRLRVLAPREDGYHEIDTLLQAVDLWDTLEGRPAAELTLRCDDPRLPTDEHNLVLRAARVLRERHGTPRLGAALTLRKSIPAGGGLGGGSSDAAGALRLLDRLWALGLAPGRLAELAAAVGSDVPFFLRGGLARGRGRGERIEPLPFPGEVPLLLGCPSHGISTARVYRALARARLTLPGNDVSLPRRFPLKLQGGKDFGFAVNDLEEVVFRDWPRLRAFRDALLGQGAPVAMLSGSGSTVFGVFASGSGARSAASVLRPRFPDWTLLPTRTSPGAVTLAPGDETPATSREGV